MISVIFKHNARQLRNHITADFYTGSPAINSNRVHICPRKKPWVPWGSHTLALIPFLLQLSFLLARQRDDGFGGARVGVRVWRIRAGVEGSDPGGPRAPLLRPSPPSVYNPRANATQHKLARRARAARFTQRYILGASRRGSAAL